MIAIGPDNCRHMLAGFHEMDVHFRDTPFERNLPVLMALVAIWNNNFLGANTVAVLPYAQYLKRFPAYLQQLRSEEHTSELQSLMRISYAVFCLKKKKTKQPVTITIQHTNK